MNTHLHCDGSFDASLGQGHGAQVFGQTPVWEFL